MRWRTRVLAVACALAFGASCGDSSEGTGKGGDGGSSGGAGGSRGGATAGAGGGGAAGVGGTSGGAGGTTGGSVGGAGGVSGGGAGGTTGGSAGVSGGGAGGTTGGFAGVSGGSGGVSGGGASGGGAAGVSGGSGGVSGRGGSGGMTGGSGGRGGAAGAGGGGSGGIGGTSGIGGAGGLAGAGGAPAGAGGRGGTGGGAGTGGGGPAGAGGAGGSAAAAGGGPGGMSGGPGGAAGAGGGGGTSGVGGTQAGGAAGTAGGPAGAGGGGIAGAGGASAGGGGSAPSCGTFDRPASRLPPDILVVLDASGSMNEDANNFPCTGGCGLNSKWSLMTAALEQVIAQTDTTVNWGLKMFGDMGNTCGVAPTVAVPIAPASATSVIAAINGRTDVNGNVANGTSTPTRRAEEVAVSYLSTLTDPSPKYILLATDGLPNCNPGGTSSTDDSAGAVAAVTAARDAGFPTFVVGIATGGGAADATLSNMAVAGGQARAGSPSYYPVTSTAEFVTVLNTLVGIAGNCEFTLPPAPTTDGTTSRSDIRVTGDGTPIARDQSHTNGWDYTTPAMTSVTLYGAACNAVRSGTVRTITIIFNCRVV